MLRTVPEAMLSWTFHILEENQPVATADFGWFEGVRPMTVEGHVYQVLAESSSGGPYRLLDGRQVIAEAKDSGGFLRRIQIVEFAGKQVEFKATSFFRRGFAIREGEQEIGRIEPEGALTRRTRADLPGHLPLAIQIFMIGYALNLWARLTDDDE